MGRHGHSVLLCNSSEMSTVAKIQKQIGLEIVQAELSHGCFNV